MPQPLPNIWNIFNLHGSPYWQDPLGDGDVTHPMHLFVGRKQELAQLLQGLFGAGASSSRHAIGGRPGIGKTTLVKQFKARALASGYLTTDSVVPIFADDTNEGLFGRVLGAVYDILLANRPQTFQNPAMQAAQVLVRASRERVRGGGVSALGIGASVSQSIVANVPRDMLLDGPRVLRELMTLVQGSDAQGVLVHINNLENLSDTAIQQAGVILRDLRDPMLMHNGLHVIVVGTMEAVQTAVMSTPQVRTVFSVLPVEPLPLSDVHQLLEERYSFMRLDVHRPAIPPVEREVHARLYDLFRGDVRGILQALDDGVTPNIGLTPVAGTQGGLVASASRPFTFDELRPALQRRYVDQMGAERETAHVNRLAEWGADNPAQSHSQKSLGQLWKVRQSTVSETLAFLVRQGYTMLLPRQGYGATEYALTGRSRLMFG